VTGTGTGEGTREVPVLVRCLVYWEVALVPVRCRLCALVMVLSVISLA